jgi:hypothetical protein
VNANGWIPKDIFPELLERVTHVHAILCRFVPEALKINVLSYPFTSWARTTRAKTGVGKWVDMAALAYRIGLAKIDSAGYKVLWNQAKKDGVVQRWVDVFNVIHALEEDPSIAEAIFGNSEQLSAELERVAAKTTE